MKRSNVYLKLRVLGAVDVASGSSVKSRIQKAAGQTYADEDGVPHVFTWRTIQTWYSLYNQHGPSALVNRPRSDKGKHRKVCPEFVREAVEEVLPEFRKERYNKTQVYRRCIETGALSKCDCSYTQFMRLCQEMDLLKPATETKNKKRQAFSKLFSNQMWQLDTMFGPHVTVGKRKVQTKLIAFIDDASRIIPHGEFFVSEKTDDLISAMRSAFFKRGVPESLYVDNGSIYTSAEIGQICSRVGTLLCHTPVRDGAAKGKIERFFRTVRDQFLLKNLDLSSIEALNREFRKWVEQEYNNRTHSILQMKPIDRFGLDIKRLRFLEPSEFNDELFFFEQTRKVGADNTFRVKNVRYEAPVDLRLRKIDVRFNRANTNYIVVYHNGERMGKAEELDMYANDRAPKGAERKETIQC